MLMGSKLGLPTASCLRVLEGVLALDVDDMSRGVGSRGVGRDSSALLRLESDALRLPPATPTSQPWRCLGLR